MLCQGVYAAGKPHGERVKKPGRDSSVSPGQVLGLVKPQSSSSYGHYTRDGRLRHSQGIENCVTRIKPVRVGPRCPVGTA